MLESVCPRIHVLMFGSMTEGGKTFIFLTGATGMHLLCNVHTISCLRISTSGYIGGAVLARLLAHPNAGTFEITALVRSPEKAITLKSKFGVNVVIGTHQELDKIHDLAMQSHIVFHLVRWQPLRLVFY